MSKESKSTHKWAKLRQIWGTLESEETAANQKDKQNDLESQTDRKNKTDRQRYLVGELEEQTDRYRDLDRQTDRQTGRQTVHGRMVYFRSVIFTDSFKLITIYIARCVTCSPAHSNESFKIPIMR